MSTSVQDFANDVQLGASRYCQEMVETQEGLAVDLIAADGPCLAIQSIGAISGTLPSLTGKIQESDDSATWTDVTGATFAAVTAANNLQAIRFTRTKRYARHFATISGTGPDFLVSVVIGEQKKLI